MQCASSLILKIVAALAAFVCLTGCNTSTTSHETSRVDALKEAQGSPEATVTNAAVVLGTNSIATGHASGSPAQSSAQTNSTSAASEARANGPALAVKPLSESTTGASSQSSKPSDASTAVNQASSANQTPLSDGALQSKSAPSASPFKPPFPNRTELFAMPKRTQNGPQGVQGDEEAVELIGFVRRDATRAILSIDGQIAPMAQGDAQYGVEVISIQPPVVVLQRGRERWQATLAN